MTPAQMLLKVQRSNPPTIRPRTGLIILPNRLDSNELARLEQNTALQMGICPVCSLKLDVKANLDGSIEFQCISENPYHWFKRNQSFLKLD